MTSTLMSLAHRGPDNCGYAVLDGGRVTMGHTRLSIVDPSDSSNQPFFNERKTICLIFNGEIYNYKALRAELEAVGRVFRTKSDTEVIVQAWEEWQVEFVRRLEGIFALALWDERTRTLFVARDHLGIKPLYYAQDKGYISFASQPRAFFASGIFEPELNPFAASDFLSFGYIPAPRSAFKNITKFPPANYLVYTDRRFNWARYWDFPVEDPRISYQDALHIVEKGFASTIRSEIPNLDEFGVFLSGGLDSSLIVAALSNLGRTPRTYSLGFADKQSDERANAREVAREYSTPHHETLFDPEHILGALAKYQFAYDEPLDLNGALPMLLVSELASRDGIKVVIGGDGADELFYGYKRYEELFSHPSSRELRSASNLLRDFYLYEGTAVGLTLHRLLNQSVGAMGEAHTPLNSLAPLFDLNDLPAHAARNCDLRHYLVDNILCKVDRASMAFGLEARVPFLNRSFIDQVGRIPSRHLFKDGERKFLLRDAAPRILNPRLISRRKKGFSCPLFSWTTPSFMRWSNGVINNGYLVATGLLNSDWQESEFIKTDHLGWGAIRLRWLLLGLELWAQRWIMNEKVNSL